MDLNKIIEYLSKVSSVEVSYVKLIVCSITLILLSVIVKYIIQKMIDVILKNDRKQYKIYQNAKLIINIILFISLFVVWDSYIKSVMTLISVLSAAFLLAIRDTILNWFCGLYIKVSRPFKIEDRIEIDGIKGDVTSLSTLSFDVLEVNDNINNGQSTGVIISFPNSIVFSKPLKNYTKGFKYIWDELVINVSLDCDLKQTKKEIYMIVNSIDIIKNIPNKMKNQISNINSKYRVYYNNYEPIIYTRVVTDHIELTLRFLIHPKKARYVESVIWNKLLIEYKNGSIVLYKNN